MAWEKVTAGQKLRQTPIHRSGFINDTIDVVNAHKEGGIARPGVGLQGWRSRTLVQVRNLTGSDLERGEVVQLGAHLLDSISEEHPWFEGNIVTEPAELRFAILTRPLKADAIGPAQMIGVCLAQVLVTDTDHAHATPSAGDTYLSSGETGPVELLMPPDGTGLQELWVLIDRATAPRVCKSNAQITDGSVGSFSLYLGSPPADSGIDFDARALFGQIPEANLWCLAIHTGYEWLAVVRHCTDEELGL